MLRKIISLILCTAMITTLLIGCNKKEVKKETGLKQETKTKDTTKKPKPITFTYFSCDTEAAQSYDNFQSAVSQKIKELTGVTLETEFVIGDPKQKLALMAASGDYPDFIYALEFSNIIVNAGGFIPLDKLIEKYGSNIKKMYGKYLKRLRWTAKDPSIYTLGLPNIGEVKYEPETGFEIQHAVLKELGYPQMRTLKDLENAVRTYKEKHPTIDGKPTLGLSLLADDWRIKITVTNPAVFATGGPDDGEWYYDTNKKRAVLHLRRPEEKEYFRWLNHMYNTGLLDPESFIQKFDQYQSKIAEGRVLSLADANWEYGEAEQTLIANGKQERGYQMLPLTLNKDTLYADFRKVGYTGGYGIGITNKCKDPVRAIKFIDWMCTDEAQVLFRWGIKGVHYDVVDGKRKFKDDIFERWKNDPKFAKETGVGLYSWPWPGYGAGAKDPNGDYYSPVFKETILEAYTDAEKETLKAYGHEMVKDFYPGPENFQESPYGVLWQLNIPADSEASLIFRKYDDVTARRVAEAVLASEKEFDSVWNKYMKELDEIGCDKLEDEFNKLLKAKMDFWNN